MANEPGKTLKITFSGICTLWPGPPRDGDKTGEKAFVIMPANMKDDQGGRQTNDWDAPIPDHFPFVHVASAALVDAPPPDGVVVKCAGGEHFVYFFQNARVAIDPSPSSRGIKYYFDPKGRPLAERPGSDDVAAQDDIRWLADIRDIIPNPPPLKASSDPTGTKIGNEVAAIVNLDAGTLKANFPADSVNPKVFKDVKGNVVPGLQRVLADEFIIEIPYPAETQSVTLLFTPLREGT